MEQAVNIWKWTAENPPQAWGKLAKDPELWDNEGDTLVYLGRQVNASFRIHSSSLLATGSSIFQTLLRDGLRKKHNDTLIFGKSSLHYDSSNTPRDSLMSDSSGSVTSKAGFDTSHIGSRDLKDQQSPPSIHLFSSNGNDECDFPVKYDLYFPAPPKLSRVVAIRYHLSTRNALALFGQRSLVGLNIAQALRDLEHRLTQYLPPSTSPTRLILQYIIHRRLHDVCNNPSNAAGLLAWSESPMIRWREGWREFFVHSVGMYPRIKELPEYRQISEVSRKLLCSAYTTLRARIYGAETRLLRFDFDDVWTDQEECPNVKAGYDSFRRFLRGYYEKTYKSWRHRVQQEHYNDSWLSRQLAKILQDDFAALYDFLVDRNVTWASSNRLKRKKGSHVFDHLDEEFIARILTKYDDIHCFTPIPHAFPLLPPSIPVIREEKHHRRGFGVLGNHPGRSREKRVQTSYAAADNEPLMSHSARMNPLIEAFRKYERTDQLGSLDPREARTGRWILLYCILQVLAGISVDTPHLFFTDTPYFLNPTLTNTPPWAVQETKMLRGEKTVVGIFDEASRLYSHCWTAPKFWVQSSNPTQPKVHGHKSVAITTDAIDASPLRSDRCVPSATTLARGRSNSEVGYDREPADSFLFNDFIVEIDGEGSLENTGLPGFRPPLPARSRSQRTIPTHVSLQGPIVPTSRTATKLPRQDVGQSDYVAPDEW